MLKFFLCLPLFPMKHEFVAVKVRCFLDLQALLTYFAQYYSILMLVDIYYSTNVFQYYRLPVLVVFFIALGLKSQLAAAKIKMAEMRHFQIKRTILY